MSSMGKAGSGVGNSTSSSTSAPTVQEFSIRVPKNVMVNHNVMQFYSSNIDFTKWSQVKMERENNMKEFRGADEEMPKFGAGSEFGREAREEARRKKYGIVTKKYRPEDQPWILKIGGKTGKKFRGVRGGGVGENASYYVFTHATDGAIDAFPIHEWYNFQPIQRYKALTAEEAEEEFGRRNKSWNLFSVMMRKRLNGGEDIEGEDMEEGKGKKNSNKKKQDLKISEMDDWVESDDDDSDSNSEGENKEDKDDSDKKKTKKGKNDVKKKKKKKKDSDDEAFEESDDGDEEGREVDYITDSSESDVDHDEKAVKEMQGVAEEDALRKLLSSGEEDDEEEEKNKEDKESEEEKNEKPGDKDKTQGSAKKKKKKLTKKLVKKEDAQGSSTDSSSDSSDSDAEAKKKQQPKEANSAASSRSATPTSDTASPDGKRKNVSTPSDGPVNKKPRLDNSFSSHSWGDTGITEDAVRRYLMRKPMTTTELLQKFKSKKTGLTSDQLVNVMTQILKRINPVKQTIKGKMYLSIKG